MQDDARTTIGCFRILSDLKTGAGSQGAVYKAVCEREGFAGVKPGTIVALKVMTVQDQAAQFARLESRTAELCALNHPNIVRYYGCFSERASFTDVHVVVLEFLEGISLKDRLATAPRGLDADEVLSLAGQMLNGLRYLSERGIVHRDIKPGNMFLCTDGRVKLIDFEVARQEGGAGTTVGGLVGTFDYMAPDFVNSTFRGDEVSDVFSFGVMLHEMLTGRTPYRVNRESDTQSSFAFMSRWSGHTKERSAIHISSRVRRVLSGATDMLEKAIAPDRAIRYQHFADLAEDFALIKFRELTYGNTHWRLLLHVGRGGFGEVFKARDVATGRLVAIKHLLHAADADRFRREARIMGEINGPHFVHLIAYFELKDKGSSAAFLVMDYLPGMPGLSLRDNLKSAGDDLLPLRPVLHAFLRYARALALLHDRGVIHRDIKPANLYFPVKTPERSAIMDFGIARDIAGSATVGQIPGSLDYMPPESIEGFRGDAGMDIYALGLCLYEALAGRTAYPRLPQGPEGLQAFIARAKAKKPPKLDTSAYGDCPELVQLIQEMTEPDRTKRLNNASEVERRLACILGLAVPSEGHPSDAFETSEDSSTACEERMTGATVVADDETIALLCDPKAPRKPERRSGSRFFIWFVVTLFLLVGATVIGFQYHRIQLERQQYQRALQDAKEQKAKADAEAKRKAEEAAEAKRKAEEAAEAKRKAEEAKRKADAEVKRKAEEAAAAEAKRKADAEAAAAEAKRKAEEAAAAEAKRKADAEAAAAEAKRKADAEAAAAEAKRKAEEAAAAEAKRKAEEAAAAEAKRKAEEAAAAEAKRKADAEAAAAEAKRKADAEAAAAEAKRKADAEAKRQAEAKRLAEMKRQNDAKRRVVEGELARLKAAFEREEADYLAQREMALKPGSRIDPGELDLKWYQRKREYSRQKRELEQRLNGQTEKPKND